jgi:histidine triad (HIT) family protein
VQDAAELALIGETEFGPVIQRNRQVLESLGWRVRGQVDQTPGHPQVDQQRRPIVEVDNQVFATAAKPRDASPLEANADHLGVVLSDHAFELADSKRDDLAADQLRFETLANRFDFGQFWHTDDGPRDSPEDARSMVARQTLGSKKMGTDETERDCIFCKIARGEFGTEFVAESETAVAFRDIHPQAPTHVLVIPRRHIASLSDLGPDDGDLVDELLALAARVARQDGVVESGYRVLTNTGPDAGQTVFHLHFHVLGGRRLASGLA